MAVRNQDPFITVRALQPVVAALDTSGYEVSELLALSNFPPSILEDSDGRIPHRTMMQFWQKAQTATSDEHLGLHLAEAAPIESLGVHAYAVLSSPTLREGYRRACRYQRLIHEVTDLIFDEDEEEGVLQHALPGGRPVPRQPAEFLVALWVRFGRLILGDQWSPRLVCFAHDAPLDTSEHERLLRTPIRFLTGRTAIHIPNHFLDEPNRKADPGLIRVLDDYAERLLEQMPSGATLSARVRTYLLNELQSGVPTAEKTARTMHMSVRTLNRNLQQEGTTFRELLTQLRQEKAATLLTNPQISISEVGYLLGFSELSSFYRAFRTWTGTTPAEYRAAALSASNSLLRPSDT